MTWLTDAILRLTGPIVLLVVFALPALEASTFVGIVVPGELALVLGGVLAHEGRVPLWAAVVAGAAGAVTGDSIGYAIGRRLGERLLRHLPRRLVRPRHVERAAALVRRLGGRAVFAGRFTAALRALVPGLAGMAAVPYRVFAIYNAAGGLLWATGFVLLGFAAGRAYAIVERIAGQAGLVVLGAIIAGSAAAAVVHRRRRGHPAAAAGRRATARRRRRHSS
jgi:membrane-associated protein